MGISIVSDLIAWLAEEMNSLAPFGNRALREGIDITVRTVDGKSSFEITKRGKRDPETVVAPDLECLEKALRKERRRTNALTRAIFGPGRCIERDIADRRLPLSRSIAAATLDAQVNTPFRSDDIEIWLSNARPTKYFIAKTTAIEDVLSIAKKLRLPVPSLFVECSGVQHRIDHRSFQGRRRIAASDRFAKWVYRVSIVALLIGSGALLVVQNQRSQAANDELDAQIAAATSSARDTKKLFDDQTRLLQQMASVRADKNLSISVVSVWEELSQIIPDGSWLSDFEIADNRLAITGYSKSAAALVPLLDASALFERPEFQSAVVKVPGIDAEKFTIGASIRSGGSR